MYCEANIRAEIARSGKTTSEVAAYLNITRPTLLKRLREGKLGIEDCNKLISFLNIKDPGFVFFGRE
jgi:DNA-binding CsgD family transcriptional regulator